MKGLLILSLVALAAAVYQGSESAFHSDHDYMFHYDGQVVTGTEGGMLISGIKLEATVKLQLTYFHRFVMQLEEVKLFKLLGEKNDIDPSEVIPNEELVEVTDDDMVAMTDMLMKPIIFKYMHGKVSDLKVEPDEPFWSINIKQGILHVFELKFDTPEVRELHPDIDNDIPSAAEEMFYTFTVMEEGLEGTCETMYMIEKMPEGEKKIKKVKDMTNCEKLPIHIVGLATALKPHKHMKEIPEKGPLDMMSEAEILVKGDSTGHLVKAAKHMAKYVITPMDHKQGALTTLIIQELTLLSVGSADYLPPPISPVSKEVFEMEIPIPIMSPDPYSLHVPHAEVEAKVTKLEELLTEIDEKSAPLTLDIPELVEEAVMIIKKLPKDSIKELIPTLSWKKKEILEQLLPADDTPKCSLLLKELLMEDIISEEKAFFLFTRHGMVAPPSPEIVETLLPFCLSEFECSKPVKSAVLLAVSNIANKIHRLKALLPPTLAEATLERVVLELHSMFRTAKTAFDLDAMKLAVKAMGNAGIPTVLPHLEKIILDKTLEPVIRKLAIYALTPLIEVAKPKIQDLLLPIFMDKREPREVKIAATTVIVSTKPCYALLAVMAAELPKEADKEFVSFVYTFLSSLAKSEDISFKIIGLNAKKALILAKPALPKYKITHALMLDTFDADGIMGMTNIFAFVRLIEEDLFPNDFFWKIETHMHNIKLELAESLIKVEGWEVLEDRLLGPEGILMEIVKGRITMLEALRAIIEILKLEVLPDALEADLSKIKFGTYLKLFANEIFHIDIEKADIKKVIEKVETMLPTLVPELIAGKPIDFFQAFVSADSGWLIPTPVGLPLAVNFTLTTVMATKGMLKLEDPHLFLSPSSSLTMKPKIITDIKPSMMTAALMKIGIETPKLQSGHVLKMKALVKPPLNMTAEIDPFKLTAKTTVELPIEEEEILVVETAPKLFMVTLPMSPDETMDITEMEDTILPKFAIPETMLLEEEEIFGMGARLEMTMMKKLMKDVPDMLLNGKNELKLILKPGTTSATKFEFKAAMLCPSCPLTTEEKHTFLFHPEEEPSDWSWFSPVRSSSRTDDFHFDEIDACDWVNPEKKFVLAFALKTKEAAEEKLFASQIAVLLNDTFKAAQLEIQTIVPPIPTLIPEVMKFKLDTKLKIPEIFTGDETLLPTGFMEPMHKTLIFAGPMDAVVKKAEIDTKMIIAEEDIEDDLDLWKIPIKTESKIKLPMEIPAKMKLAIEKIIDLLEKLPIETNMFKVKDKFIWEEIEEMMIEAKVIPTERKLEMLLKFPGKVTEIDVCPFFVPFPVTHCIEEDVTPIDEVPEPVDDPDACIRKLMTHKVRRINEAGEEEVCFSKVPIATCKGPCRAPEHFVEREVAFHCLPRYAPTTQRLVMESLVSVLESMELKTTDLMQIVDVPEECIPL